MKASTEIAGSGRSKAYSSRKSLAFGAADGGAGCRSGVAMVLASKGGRRRATGRSLAEWNVEKLVRLPARSVEVPPLAGKRIESLGCHRRFEARRVGAGRGAGGGT